jgi:cytoskeletal protein CcmA (bactofilin family)
MWGSRTPTLKNQLIDSLVGESCKVVGDVYFEGEIHIDGFIQGNIYARPGKEAVVIVGESGCVEGEVVSPVVVINGAVIGDVRASRKLHLGESSKVEGTVYYHLIEMEVGAEINGALNKLQGIEAEEPLPELESEPEMERPMLESQTKNIIEKILRKKDKPLDVAEEAVF